MEMIIVVAAAAGGVVVVIFSSSSIYVLIFSHILHIFTPMFTGLSFVNAWCEFWFADSTSHRTHQMHSTFMHFAFIEYGRV